MKDNNNIKINKYIQLCIKYGYGSKQKPKYLERQTGNPLECGDTRHVNTHFELFYFKIHAQMT